MRQDGDRIRAAREREREAMLRAAEEEEREKNEAARRCTEGKEEAGSRGMETLGEAHSCPCRAELQFERS